MYHLVLEFLQLHSELLLGSFPFPGTLALQFSPSSIRHALPGLVHLLSSIVPGREFIASHKPSSCYLVA